MRTLRILPERREQSSVPNNGRPHRFKIKKEEGVRGLPLRSRCTAQLELESYRKLDLTHVRAPLEAGDLAIIATRAVYARICPVVRAESVDRMVKDVESVHQEPSTELFRDGEGFRERHIRVETSRPEVAVALEVSDATARWK